MGVYSMLFFSGLYLRSIFRIQKKTRYNYTFRILLFFITFTTFVCHSYAVSVLITDTDVSNSMDPHHCEYVKWLLTTPTFIVLICWLEKCKPLNTTLLVLADVTMIGIGYASYLAPTDTQFWELFIFSGCVWCFIIAQLLRQTYFFYYDGLAIRMMFLNHNIASTLVGLITVSWSVYPMIVILKRNDTISLSTEFILYTVFDCLNKGVYGLMFLAAKEVEEKIESRLANYTLTAAAVVPVKTAYKRLESHPTVELEIPVDTQSSITHVNIDSTSPNKLISTKIEP